MNLRKALGYAVDEFLNEFLYSLAKGDIRPLIEYFSRISQEFREIMTGYWENVDRDS
jgi:hypothetical protein